MSSLEPQITGGSTQREASAAAPRLATPKYLHVRIAPPERYWRGHLGEYVDECIERELRSMGTPERACSLLREADVLLTDQLSRAARLGYQGMRLRLGSLQGVLSDGTLVPQDQRALTFWRTCSHVHDVEIEIEDFPTDLASARELDAGSSLVEAAPGARACDLDAPSEPAHEPTATSEEPQVTLWRENLEHASGAQSWQALEQLFVGSYLPLCHATLAGTAGELAERAVATWAKDFQQCYSEAYRRIQRGAPRPNMSCDVPQLAFRLARELGATRTRLVLVDGMRFDLGQQVHDKLRIQLTPLARCVARGVLWAALPVSTLAQLELLARGPAALSRLRGGQDDAAWIARGAQARRLRTLRVGGVALDKLDVVQAEFADSPWSAETLQRAAAEVAVSLGRHLKRMEPGTLVLIFGDHGFATRGGEASACEPEQVLVPYDAWLVRDAS